MKKLIILMGVPASGKSTWVKEYMKEHASDTCVVSRDEIRLRFGEYNHKHEKEVTLIEEQDTEDAMKSGCDIINDATNLNPKHLPRWEKMAKKYGYEIEYVKFHVPIHTALERDKNTDRSHHVGKRGIKNFYRLYYPEEYAEYINKTINYYRIPEDKTLIKAIICDLDGTFAWMQNRSPYDMTRVDEDLFDPRMLEVIHTFMQQGIEVLFVTGREATKEGAEKTLNWIKNTLNEKIYHVTKFSGQYDRFQLFMRKSKDYRHDYEVKEDIYLNKIKPFYDIICVFEDKNNVVNMWRKQGLLCCQVANEEDL